MPDSPGTWNQEETGLPGLPLSCSHTLFSGSGPVGLPLVPWTEETIESSPFFSETQAIAAEETWLEGHPFEFFFEWLAKVSATG
jgi:hypothetical protein